MLKYVRRKPRNRRDSSCFFLSILVEIYSSNRDYIYSSKCVCQWRRWSRRRRRWTIIVLLFIHLSQSIYLFVCLFFLDTQIKFIERFLRQFKYSWSINNSAYIRSSLSIRDASIIFKANQLKYSLFKQILICYNSNDFHRAPTSSSSS